MILKTSGKSAASTLCLFAGDKSRRMSHAPETPHYTKSTRFSVTARHNRGGAPAKVCRRQSNPAQARRPAISPLLPSIAPSPRGSAGARRLKWTAARVRISSSRGAHRSRRTPGARTDAKAKRRKDLRKFFGSHRRQAAPFSSTHPF